MKLIRENAHKSKLHNGNKCVVVIRHLHYCKHFVESGTSSMHMVSYFLFSLRLFNIRIILSLSINIQITMSNILTPFVLRLVIKTTIFSYYQNTFTGSTALIAITKGRNFYFLPSCVDDIMCKEKRRKDGTPELKLWWEMMDNNKAISTFLQKQINRI